VSVSNDLQIFIVRHAESKANTNGVLDTRAPGGPLTAKGIKQARKLAKTLRGLNLKREVAAVYSSPFLRTQKTAEIIAEKNRVRLKTSCASQDGTTVLDGEALVSPPKPPKRND